MHKLDLRAAYGALRWTLLCTSNKSSSKNFMLKTLCVFIFILWYFGIACAQDTPSGSNRALSSKEKTINFTAVYATQWAYYLIAHDKEIKKYGSFENWLKNSINPHYDRDGFEYNLIRHTFAGQYYYLFYRSRQYTEENAFIWSFISSFAFEFTIETATERPSYQDLYQTPVFGTVLGVGVERLSIYLHSSDTWIGHFVGYLINPFTLIPATNQVFGVVVPEKNQVSVVLQWQFE